MQPYEFGYRLGNVLEKQAATSAVQYEPGMHPDEQAPTFGRAVSDVAFGRGPVFGDDADRGVIPHMALMSNPFTGVPTAAYDAARNLYQGNYFRALGNVADGALSFIPGYGFARGAAGLGLRAAGKGLMSTGARYAGQAGLRGAAGSAATRVGSTLAKAPRLAATGNRYVQGAQNMMSNQIQRVAKPLAAPTGPNTWGNIPRRMYNFSITNPIERLGGGVPGLSQIGYDPLGLGARAMGEYNMPNAPQMSVPGSAQAYGGYRAPAGAPLGSF